MNLQNLTANEKRNIYCKSCNNKILKLVALVTQQYWQMTATLLLEMTNSLFSSCHEILVRHAECYNNIYNIISSTCSPI